MILLRAIVRLVTVVLLVLLAVVGLVLAVSCIAGGTNPLSLAWTADGLHLPELRDSVGSFIDRVEEPGDRVNWVSALAGLGAMLLGALLLYGLLPRRERLVTLTGKREGGGRLGARKRPLAQAAGTLAEQVRGVTSVKTKVRSARGAGGRLSVTADRTRRSDADATEAAVTEALGELTDPFKLRSSVRTRLGEGGERVQ